MAVLSELRYPTTRLAKVFSGLLAIILFGIVSIGTVSGFLLYQILKPARTVNTFDLSVMMGHPSTFSFPVAGGAMRDGWFFPGLRGAPTIVVCHGYLSQRADVLTLVTALQDHQFNVYLFDFAGHGTSPDVTTLGYRETAELRSAVQAISTRDDVNPQHFGLWGVDMGGYAALEVAASDPRISAFVVDNAYDDPRDMVQIEVRRSGLAVLPYVTRFCDFGFRMLNYSFRNEPPVSTRLAQTRGIPKMFIQTSDRPALADDVERLFARAPDPKQIVRDRMGYSEMSDEDRKAYENQIINFFLQYIPPTAAR
jgi:pimeloyl-ACP methyl ester carboxylesterase